MMEEPLLQALYWVLGFFTIASTLLSVYSITNSLRLRNVRLAWNAGHILGYPLFASVFLLFMALVTSLVVVRGETEYYPTVIGYSWIGVNWFLASFLSSRRYITDHGIVKNINEPSQTIAWHQMTDFFQSHQETRFAYTFLYRETDSNGRLNGPLLRLQLTVPKRKAESFQRIVRLKLDRRGFIPSESLPKITSIE